MIPDILFGPVHRLLQHITADTPSKHKRGHRMPKNMRTARRAHQKRQRLARQAAHSRRKAYR